jgi:hypothetical protein
MVEQLDVVTGKPGPPAPQRETNIEFISNPARFWRGSNEWLAPAMHNRQKRDRGCTTINPRSFASGDLFPRAAPPVQLCPERIQSLAFASANRITPSTFRSQLLPLVRPSPS